MKHFIKFPKNDLFNFFDKVVYINLDHRKDRRESIEKTLSIFPSEKIHRFSAIQDSIGAIGCTKSHIAVLEMAIEQKWKNVLVVEDDAIWNVDYKNIQFIIKQNVEKNFDVLLFGGTYVKCDTNERVISAQTTTAYLVNQNYYNTLLNNFKEGIKNLQIKGSNPNDFAIDQYWKKLMKVDNWKCILPSILVQKPDYSDIEKRSVDYRNYFS